MACRSILACSVISERALRHGWLFLPSTNERKGELLGHLCLKRFFRSFKTLRGINSKRGWSLKAPDPNMLVHDSWRSESVISSSCCLSRAWPYSAAAGKQAWQSSVIRWQRCQDVGTQEYISSILSQEVPLISPNRKWGHFSGTLWRINNQIWHTCSATWSCVSEQALRDTENRKWGNI